MKTEHPQLFYPAERMALFVDGLSIYIASKGLQFDIDFKAILRLFASKGVLLRANYYTVVGDDAEYDHMRPLVDYLSFNGWNVTAKPGSEYTDSSGKKKFKGTIQPDLIVDAMVAAHTVDHIVLFSGDSNYCPLVEEIQKRGRRVSIVSTLKTNPPMCADELRRQGDNFIELEEIRTQIMRPARPAPVPPTDHLQASDRAFSLADIGHMDKRAK